MRLGSDIADGSDIENAIKDLRGTTVCQIEPNREIAKGKISTLPGISNWFEWQWPIEGPFSGYILARALPNIGEWTKFSPAKIQKLSKNNFSKPQPIATTPSEIQSTWTIPIPHVTGNYYYALLKIESDYLL